MKYKIGDILKSDYKYLEPNDRVPMSVVRAQDHLYHMKKLNGLTFESDYGRATTIDLKICTFAENYIEPYTLISCPEYLKNIEDF